MNLNHDESLFTAVYCEDCLALANYLNQSSPEQWADWKEVCLLGDMQPETYRKGVRELQD